MVGLQLPLSVTRESCLPKSLSISWRWHSDCLSSLQLIASEYLKLEAAIDELDTSVGNALDRQKQDLERAHKTETEKIKAEIENLITEKRFIEDSMTSNERSNQLETERDWYKKEALHLDEVLEQSKVQQKKLTDQLFESEQVAKLTKRQVGKLTKRSRALEDKLKELGVDVNTIIDDGIYILPEMEEQDVSEKSEIKGKWWHTSFSTKNQRVSD